MLNILNQPQNEGCNAIPDGFVEAPGGETDERLDFMRRKTTEMGYRFVGRHSAIKVCNWTKECIRGRNACYKNRFYGISSNQCVQMTPVMFFCNFNCLHCWRNFNYVLPEKDYQWDDPVSIIDGCIEAQKQILQGFWGNLGIDTRKLEEAMTPKHFAISLSGEPMLYPHLPQMIDEITSRKMTAYLVTNGTVPEMTERLLEHQPTNLYISLYGTTPEMYRRTAVPMTKDFWENLYKSLALLKEFSCNTVIRLTLTRGLNFTDPEGYAKIIEKAEPRYLEVKAFMAVGGSRRVLKYEDMPLHSEIREFAEEIEKHSSYKISNEKADSRVVLMARS